jgi:hypothetical protein
MMSYLNNTVNGLKLHKPIIFSSILNPIDRYLNLVSMIIISVGFYVQKSYNPSAIKFIDSTLQIYLEVCLYPLFNCIELLLNIKNLNLSVTI